MYILIRTTTPPLHFSQASLLSSTTRRRGGGDHLFLGRHCGISKKGSIEAKAQYVQTYHNSWNDEPSDSRQGHIVILPQVCVQDYYLEQEIANKISENKIQDCINSIKTTMSSIDEGRISVSAYDTAWVALIRDVDGGDRPQFPSSLEWIAHNQLADGSWGYQDYFLVYDRLVCTLACIIALKSWHVHVDKIEKGISFIKENMHKLEDANAANMTCGFETVFPVLLQRAKDLDIQGIPFDAPVIREIYAVRDQKMKRVPRELIHEVATCMLYNLEGLEDVGLDWQKLLKLQAPKGSFLTSPAATAFAIMNTKDENCLAYIQNIVDKFDGGAPPNYPVDIYGRLWVVDRLERLGISRFFDAEITDCLNHIYSFWSDKGVYCAGDSEFVDIDDTSMSFRLLRLHGYNVTPNALKNFKKDNAFTCYVGQQFESPSPLFNLYRATQVLFPGETILEEANQFTHNFLKEKLQSNQLSDKWLISKHLPDEISHGLEMPWYASLPRLETRLYLEDYGVDDVWIGKSLYSMPDINNEAYLELARLDYNRCQEQHQKEWNLMQQWYEKSSLQEFGITKKDLLLAYFLATASIFEPERSTTRLAWVKSQIVLHILSSHNHSIKEAESSERVAEFGKNFGRRIKCHKSVEEISAFLIETLLQINMDTQEQIGQDTHDVLYIAWGVWLRKLGERFVEECELAIEPIISTINICGGYIISKEILSHHEYENLSILTTKICRQLQQFESNGNVLGIESKNNMHIEIQKDMQLLVQLVFMQESNGVSKDIKQTFFMVARTFYYKAYFTAQQIDVHLSKVLFQQVL